jgi:hypothetical protein
MAKVHHLITVPLMQDTIDEDLFHTFLEMRQHDCRKPMSQRAVDMLVRKLSRLEAQGHDPNLLLERSIIGGWQDVYPDESTKRAQGFAALHTDRSWAK